MSDVTEFNITEDDLHAFVDGDLSRAKYAHILVWFKTHPEAEEQVQQWLLQNAALEHLFVENSKENTHHNEKSDAELLTKLTRKTNLGRFKVNRLRLASFVPTLLFGAIVGAMLTLQFAPNLSVNNIAYAQNLPAISRASYTIYSAEKKHPVEVGIDEKQHLIAWLGKRIDRELTPPDLTSMGFDLFGGRILPLAGKPSAMLMYEDDAGERLTLIIGQNDDNEQTGFSFVEQDNVQTFFWVDRDFGYAISGKLSRAKMESIANMVYKQL